MKKIKSIITILCCFLLLTGFSNPINPQEEEIYKEEGQIQINSLNDLFNNSKIAINSEEFIDILSENLIKEVQRYQSMGMTSISIGYTQVFTQEKVINGNKEQVIMSKKEVNEMKKDIGTLATGPISTSPGGTLTLYTLASYNGLNNEDIYATSVADWTVDGWWVGEANKPSSGRYDYLSLAMPIQYTMIYHVLGGGPNHGQYVENNTNNGVTYGFKLYNGLGSAMYFTQNISGIGRKNSYISSKKIISHYVHNYNTEKLSVGFNVDGISITHTPTINTWKISSYVVLY